jgi:hypothetical protein
MRTTLLCVALITCFPILGMAEKKTAESSPKVKEAPAKEEPAAKGFRRGAAGIAPISIDSHLRSLR